jgi:ATP-dependent helicase/nuclease subunit B
MKPAAQKNPIPQNPTPQNPQIYPPQVYTIPAARNFLDSVAGGVLAQTGGDPLALADYTILVPTRDVAAALRQSFIEQSQKPLGILPQIISLADIDDREFSLKIGAQQKLAKSLLKVPPAVSRLERQIILAQEIMKIEGMASSPQKAMSLGAELGRFLDDIQRHDVSLDSLEALVPVQFKTQWAKTAEFLKIITDVWPAKLAEMQRLDPETRRTVVMQIQAEHWRLHPADKPVLAAGFTDTGAALATLLKAVAALPQGAVVLQGLDSSLDAQEWDKVTEGHPAHHHKSLLQTLGVGREAVQEWSALSDKNSLLDKNDLERQKLLSQAMRPSGGNSPVKIGVQALNGLDFMISPTEQEEAGVIALKLRETLETAGRKTVLVTADRSLARRVSARLRAWEIEVADEAGLPLAHTLTGIFLSATAAMAAEEWAPIALLEALKHPLTGLGDSRENFRKNVAALEDTVLHGVRPEAGAAGMTRALTIAFNRSAKKKVPADKEQLLIFTDKLQQAGAAFFDAMKSPAPVAFGVLLEAHIRFAEALAATDTMTGTARLWGNAEGKKAAEFLSQLRDVAGRMPDMTGRDYADVLQGLLRDVKMDIPKGRHPFLRIVTPEQAQFIKADTVIIGGMNNGIFPPEPQDNPWLSPDMMRQLKLPSSESAIGHAAHCFVQAASQSEVLLSRARRSGNAPAVESLFMTRLMMVLKQAGLKEKGFDKNLTPKTSLPDIHAALQKPAQMTVLEPPAPTPAIELRPKQLPVTAIEALMRDPYSVYAKYILQLRPKQSIDTSPGVSERGIFTHAALDAFVKKYPVQFPDNAVEELLKIGQETFQTRMDNPAVRAFWWPRFERIAEWFVAFESERRALSKTIGSEVQGRIEMDMGDSVFTLTALADRIDRGQNDALTVIDYKTGSVPTQKSVALGFSPQLTLEALIAFSGGFKGIDAGAVGKIQYWKLTGGRPAGTVTEVKGDVQELVEGARQGVEDLIRSFNDPATPYLSSPRPEWAPRYNDYQHLSRVDEWNTVRKTNSFKEKKSGTRRFAGKKESPKND